MESALRSVLEILSDYADDLILIGGWVPYLHLTYGRAAVTSPRTSRTTEADLLLPATMRRHGRRPLVEILREAGFDQRGVGGVIWTRAPAERGEVIEFMQSFHGPARNRGAPGRVADQPGLRALTLDHLRVMEEFTQTIFLSPSRGCAGLEVRIPTLGAFVLNKANTFHLRGGDDAGVKAGKDLLYLRDVLAAGDRPLTVLEEDLDTIARATGNDATIRRAAHHLRHLAPRYHRAVAGILSERDGLDPAAARADVEGHLEDAAEIVEGRSSP
jgi:hypothetical protein